ncbi:MAG: hypothetical protein ACE5FU_01845 [Nitrospinota bacterium]
MSKNFRKTTYIHHQQSLKGKNLLLWFTLLLLLFLSPSGCGVGPKEEEEEVKSIVTLTVTNRSQFSLHHLFLHTPNESYRDAESRIDSPFPPDSSMSLTLIVGKKYLFTVTRKKNKDSSLLAYTTQEPFSIELESELTYFDTQFRLEAKQ